MDLYNLDRRASMRGQLGLSTVLVSLVLLLASTLIVFFLARSTITEQRISGNEVRAKQAMAAAEAGLNEALQHMQENGIDQQQLSGSLQKGGTDYAFYRVAFCDQASPGHDGTCPEAVGAVSCNFAAAGDSGAVAVACGWSDDQSARHMVSRLLRSSPSLGGQIDDPLTAKGIVRGSGNLTVANYYNNSTVVTGEGVDDSSGTPKLFVCDPNLGDCSGSYSGPVPVEGNNFANTNNLNHYMAIDDLGAQKYGSVQERADFGNLSGDEFFTQFMGETPAFYREKVATQDVAAADFDPTTAAGQVVWVDGDVSIGDEVGSREQPVVLVVDGDAEFTANAEVHGVVYVRGELSGNGGPQIFGAMIGEGEVDGTGAIQVIFDPVALGGASEQGQAASVPGTWRDWPQQ